MLSVETWLPLLLLPLPLLVYRLSHSLHERQSALYVPFLTQLSKLSEGQAGTVSGSSKQGLQWIYLLAMWLLLLAACCRPVWIGEPIPVREEARNVMLAVDISESMLEADIFYQKRFVRRLALVKYRLGEFIERRLSDRMGLILFADSAYLQSPLTYDYATVNQYLQEARVGFAGTYTAIGDAIALGIKRLNDRSEDSRILILLTDGENSAGKIDPLKASQFAAEQGIKIYTIGIHPNNRELSRDAIYVLRDIAESTGGQHFLASNDEELQRVYVELDKLEPVSQDERFFTPKKSYFYLPLAAFLVFGVLGLLLRSPWPGRLLADSKELQFNTNKQPFAKHKPMNQKHPPGYLGNDV